MTLITVAEKLAKRPDVEKVQLMVLSGNRVARALVTNRVGRGTATKEHQFYDDEGDLILTRKIHC